MHAQSLLTLCDLMDCSPPLIFQAQIMKWAATSYSRNLPDPGIEPESSVSPALADGFFTTAPPQFSSVQFTCSVVSDSLRPHGL